MIKNGWLYIYTPHNGIYTLRYYLVIKYNKTMPFAAIWMDLESIILSKVSQKEIRRITYDITYMRDLQYDTNEHIYETKTSSQI